MGTSTLDVTFSRALLREGLDLVRLHFKDVKPREAWVWHAMRDTWEFHYQDFYWHGSAGNAYHARYKGWMAWLRSKGIVE